MGTRIETILGRTRRKNKIVAFYPRVHSTPYINNTCMTFGDLAFRIKFSSIMISFHDQPCPMVHQSTIEVCGIFTIQASQDRIETRKLNLNLSQYIAKVSISLPADWRLGLRIAERQIPPARTFARSCLPKHAACMGIGAANRQLEN